MTGEDFRGLGTRYLAEIERLAPGATHITDKMLGILFLPASSIWRCRMRPSSTPSATRSIPAYPASPNCSPRNRTILTI